VAIRWGDTRQRPTGTLRRTLTEVPEIAFFATRERPPEARRTFPGTPTGVLMVTTMVPVCAAAGAGAARGAAYPTQPSATKSDRHATTSAGLPTLIFLKRFPLR